MPNLKEYREGAGREYDENGLVTNGGWTFEYACLAADSFLASLKRQAEEFKEEKRIKWMSQWI